MSREGICREARGDMSRCEGIDVNGDVGEMEMGKCLLLLVKTV